MICDNKNTETTKKMTTKTQILTNIVLVICFAFSVHVAVRTNDLIAKIGMLLYNLEERENEYRTKREEVLTILEEAIAEESENLQTF